ncbi:MAG: hypothetical protein B7W97_00615 [Mycobacterium sp. 20-66-4]|nr:MAG: hypothetical protein B7W97_00615 [Mycobacterium sp. 20-66-4]
MIRDLRAPIDATWIGEWDGHARGFNAGDWAVTHAAHDGHGDIHITVHGVQYDAAAHRLRVGADGAWCMRCSYRGFGHGCGVSIKITVRKSGL